MNFDSIFDLISGDSLQAMVDFSFGDKILPFSNPIEVSLKNETFAEYLDTCRRINKKRLTLFVDNIRLHNRYFPEINESENAWRLKHQDESGLLEVCRNLPEFEFIIFCNYDDSNVGTDVRIAIPPNVLGVFAPNAVGHGGKLHVLYYGIQRKIHVNDDRNEWFITYLNNRQEFKPKNLFYANFNINTNKNGREGIFEKFENKTWATVNKDRLDFREYIRRMDDHQYVACPLGNAEDCTHRVFEALYLNRYPVMIRNNFLEKVCEGLPVLFIDSWEQVNEEFLESSLMELSSCSKKLGCMKMKEYYNSCLSSITDPVSAE